MLRIIAMAILLATLPGCGELRVIGKAAVRELQAEAINVEWLDHQKRDETASGNTAQRTVVTKVETKSFAALGRSNRATYQKGLWEGH